MEIRRPKLPKLVFELEDAWHVLDEKQQLEVAKAIANPVRYAILKELDAGPIRQFELVGRLAKILGKRYPPTVVRHHLKQLERVGLIEFDKAGGQTRGKIVYRAADVRVHLRPRPKPTIRVSAPRTPKELEEGLRRILMGE